MWSTASYAKSCIDYSTRQWVGMSLHARVFACGAQRGDVLEGEWMLTYRAGAGAAFAVVIAAVPVGLASPGVAQTAQRVKASPVAALPAPHSSNGHESG